MALLSIRIDPTSVARLFETLDAATATATLEGAMHRALARIQHDLATYPPPVHPPQPFRSDRQRRKVFALIREGRIPYRRTGNLGRKWTTDVSRAGVGGIQGTVGNNTPYAPFVEGKKTQAKIHEGVWPTDADVLARRKAEIEQDFAESIDDALRKALP